jgi:hypothetical protein
LNPPPRGVAHGHARDVTSHAAPSWLRGNGRHTPMKSICANAELAPQEDKNGKHWYTTQHSMTPD